MRIQSQNSQKKENDDAITRICHKYVFDEFNPNEEILDESKGPQEENIDD